MMMIILIIIVIIAIIIIINNIIIIIIVVIVIIIVIIIIFFFTASTCGARLCPSLSLSQSLSCLVSLLLMSKNNPFDLHLPLPRAEDGPFPSSVLQ